MQSDETIEVAKGLTEKALVILAHEIQDTKRIQETLANEVERLNATNIQLSQALAGSQEENKRLRDELHNIKFHSAAGEEVETDGKQ